MNALNAAYERGVQDAFAKFSARAPMPRKRAPVGKPAAAPAPAPQPAQPGFGSQMAMQALPIAASIGLPMAMDKIMGGPKPPPVDEFA